MEKIQLIYYTRLAKSIPKLKFSLKNYLNLKPFQTQIKLIYKTFNILHFIRDIPIKKK